MPHERALLKSLCRPASRKAAVVAVAGAIAGGAAVAGPLDPPPGPPMPTMKRLDQIEPRRCLNDLATADAGATAVVSITEPGRYYLTADLVCPAGKSAVVVSAAGSVEIDLNGFSIRGLAGAIDGVVGAPASVPAPGARLAISGGGSGATRGSVFGFSGRGIATGDAGPGWSEIEVSNLAVLGCAKGIEHLQAQKIIHRDIACRSCPQGGTSIFGEAAPAAPGGLRRRNSISMTRCELVDCGGAAALVVRAGGGGGRIRGNSIDIRGSLGAGISITRLAGAAGVAGEACDVSLERCSVSDSSLGGIDIVGVPSQGAARFPFHFHMSRIELARCGGVGISATDADSITCDTVSASDCSGPALRTRRPGRCTFGNITLERCAGGLDVSDAGQATVERVRAVDTIGDALAFSACRSVSISGGAIVGIVVGTVAGRGIVTTDCDSVKVSDCDVSRCVGQGVVHAFTNSSTGASASIAHWGTRVERCAGAGVVVTHARTALGELELRLANFGLLSCASGGLLVDCSGAGPGARVSVRCQDGSCRGSTAGSGVGLLCGQTTHFRVDMSGVSLTGNSGDGLAVVNAAAPGTAIAGQTTLNGCDLSNNGGSGCVTDNPLYAGSTTMGSNVLHGARCVAPDGTTLAASMDGCTIARNGSDGVRVARGRYANADCQISDNGGTGIVVADGCLLMTNSMVHRSGGDGVSVVGTLTVHGGALRRNAGAGARSSGGPVSLEACAVELNGAGSATVAPGLGGLALSDCATVRVSRCSLSENTGPGMRHLRAQATFSDMTSIDVTECTAGHNTGAGILLDGFVGGSVSSCVAAGNAGGALSLGSNSSRCRVGGNTFSAPAGQGDALLRVFGSAHLVVGNSLSGGGAGVPPIVGGQGSTVGQVVSGADVSTRCSPSDNIVH